MARSLAKQIESVSVREFYESFAKALELELVAGEAGLGLSIGEKSVNRPALALTGYFKYFANKRIQLFGAGEMAYLQDLSEATQHMVLKEIVNRMIPCIIISRDLEPTPAMVNVAEEHGVPLFRTTKKSKDFSAEVTILLEHKFSPTTTLHGTLLDIKGMGTFLRGDSGVGKSECALALIERGHSLVADDLTYCRKVGDDEIIGTSSHLNRGYMECRGLGIIDIAKLFGVRAVRLEKTIDLVVTFVVWNMDSSEERTGLDQYYFDILGAKVPHVEIPVRPGRDMARLSEVAAMVQALRLTGVDSANEFNERLIAHMAKK